MTRNSKTPHYVPTPEQLEALQRAREAYWAKNPRRKRKKWVKRLGFYVRPDPGSL